MHIGSIYLVISVIFGITFLTFGSVDSAYAVDYVVSAATCTGLPGGGTNWDGPTSTCSKTNNNNMIIGALDTLTVPNGVTLKFTTNRDLINDGSITNNGIINFTLGGDLTNQNSATFTNLGIMELNSTTGGTALLNNRNTATFTNTITGIIIIDGPGGQDAQIRNRDTAAFTNSGTITIEGTSNGSGTIRNFINAAFTNSGTITIEGTSNGSGRLSNEGTSTFTNSGIITISGTDNNSGQIRNIGSSSTITNSGIITVTGINSNSGLIINDFVLTNSGTLTTNKNFDNGDADSILTNSGTLQITGVLDNTSGLIINNCGEITFGTINGNTIQEETCPSSSSSTAYEDPTIGKSHDGRQMVEDGICIDDTCWTVTAAYHQDFELVEMLSDSTHTISTTVFCQHGVNQCNYVAFGVSPYGTNINDSIWKVILQKDHNDNWSMEIIDDDEYLGEVTSTTQIVNDDKHLSASATIEFKKSTPGMILNVEVRDSKGGYRDFKFNDGIAILDSYAYPSIDSSYEAPLDIEPLCINANPDKRYTCAFEKIKDQTLIDAQIAYRELMGKQNYHDLN